jgi:ribose transport system substrate-binding protein
MKKILLFCVCLFLVVSSVGCAQSTPDTALLAPQDAQMTALPAETQPTKKYTIALVMKTLTNPFFVEMEKGARRAETEFGINLIVKTGAQETSFEQQITIIEELIKEKVDAILISPADSVQIIPVLKKAREAGIVIVNIDNQLDPQALEKVGLTDIPFVSVNNEQGAYLSAQYLSQQVSAPTQAILLEGIPTARNAQDRKSGALRAFGENSNITVVASESAHWKIDEAYTLSAQLFKQYPDTKLVFCANDMMALGLLQYLKESSKNDVRVASYDALDEAKEMIRVGRLQATIDQQAALQAYTGVQLAIRALKGETLPAVTLLDVLLVTKENVK